MKRLLIMAGLAGVLATGANAAMSEADCAAAWTKADANSDGVLTEAEATQTFAALRVANIPVPDGKLTREKFAENCKAGVLTVAKNEAGAPVSGANSFTENQAKDRAVAAGFSNVSALQKDANGIWRGSASDGAKQVNIAIDFKGNVVAN